MQLFIQNNSKKFRKLLDNGIIIDYNKLRKGNKKGGETMNTSELKAAMARKDISIPKLSELLEINKKTMYSRFSGETEFSLSEIKKIAEVLELSNEDILIIFFTEKVA